MPDPLTIGLGISAGSALLNALLGKEDEFKMSPQQRQLYNLLLGKYQAGDYGVSDVEQAGILNRIKQSLQEESQARTASSLASLSRRNLLSPGQAAGITTDIGTAYGKAYGKAATEVPLWAKEVGRRRKSELERALIELSGGTYIPGGDVPGLGDLSQNLMLLKLLSAKQSPGGADWSELGDWYSLGDIYA